MKNEEVSVGEMTEVPREEGVLGERRRMEAQAGQWL